MRKYFILSLSFILFLNNLFAQPNFVKTINGQFTLNNKPHYFIGANYWYGGLLGNTPKGKLRLQKELNFLSKNNLTSHPSKSRF
jgi:hypothetical protein